MTPLACRASLLLVVSACLAATVDAAPAGNVPRGKRAFSAQCIACHAPTATHQPTGPGLAGVVGRAAAKAEGFAYSEALKKSGLTWTPETLDRYLAAPAEVVPGTSMVLAVPQASTRADLIAYLQTLGAAPGSDPAPAAPAAP